MEVDDPRPPKRPRGRPKTLSEDQRKKNRQTSNRKNRQRQKEENRTLSEENKTLREENKTLRDENQILKEENQNLKDNQSLSSNLEDVTMNFFDTMRQDEEWKKREEEWKKRKEDWKKQVEELMKQARASEEAFEKLKSKADRLENKIEAATNEKQESPLGLPPPVDEPWSELEMLEIWPEVAQNNNFITSNPGSTSQAATCYCTSTNIAQFVMKLDENEKSNVSWADFPNLQGEQRTLFEQYSIPFSLLPSATAIKETYGDISQNIRLSSNVVETSYIFFCATMKEIRYDLQLEKVTEEKMLKWRDAINDAKVLQLHVDFAWQHLKTIAYAYFGMQQMQYQQNVWSMQQMQYQQND